VVALFCTVILGSVSGKDIFVDNRHPAANDTNPGSAEAPLKTIQWAADLAQPGDHVFVEPGRYPENVVLKTQGSPGNPIIFQGAPNHGTVLDGAEPLIGWHPCKSPTECGGNKNFLHLHWTWLPAGVTPISANLYEGDTLLHIAQDPLPPDPFYYDDRSVMRPIPEHGYSSTQIVDREYFTQDHPDYWVGAIVLVRTGNNAVIPRSVTGYLPDEGRITFAETTRHINPGKDQFSIMNHPNLIQEAGQYAVLPPTPDGRRKVVLWPLDQDSFHDKVTCSVRKVGFNVNGKNHIQLVGFRFQRYSGNTDDLRAGSAVLNLSHTPTTGLVVRDCEVLQCKAGSGYWAINCGGCNDSVIEGNYVHHNQMNRGISVRGSGSRPAKNVVIRNNVVQRGGGTGITFYYVRDSRIIGNQVIGNHGNHANGITCYLHSSNVLISQNRVLDGNMAVTVQQSSDVTISNNLLSGRDGQSRILVLYGRGERINVFNNTVLNSTNGGGISVPKDARLYAIKNNIADGILHGRDVEHLAGVVLENNLYTSLSWVQTPETLGSNAIVEKDLSKVFLAPDRGDYHLRPDSPARDAGTFVECTQDLDGVERPQGDAFDIGAYEYADAPNRSLKRAEKVTEE
jgi:hypothetical protein